MVTKDAFAIGQVVAIGQRITRLEGEITNLNADKAEIYREARGNGFDVKALKKAIKKWQRLQDDPQAEQEAAALEDLYLAALTGQDGAETAQDRISVAANGLPKSPTRARTSSAPETPANSGGMAAGQEPLKSIAPAAETKAQPEQASLPVGVQQEAPAEGEGADCPEPSAPIQEHTTEGSPKGDGGHPTDETGDGALAGDDLISLKSPDPADQSYDEAVKLARSGASVTIALLKSALNLDYGEAATIIERMEREGIISAPLASGKREVIDDLGDIPAHLDRRKPKATYSATELLGAG